MSNLEISVSMLYNHSCNKLHLALWVIRYSLSCPVEVTASIGLFLYLIPLDILPHCLPMHNTFIINSRYVNIVILSFLCYNPIIQTSNALPYPIPLHPFSFAAGLCVFTNTVLYSLKIKYWRKAQKGGIPPRRGLPQRVADSRSNDLLSVLRGFSSVLRTFCCLGGYFIVESPKRAI